jgi:hypothetical protein
VFLAQNQRFWRWITGVAVEDGLKQMYANNGFVFFTTWDDLVERAKLSHYQFRETLQKRAAEASEVLGPDGK